MDRGPISADQHSMLEPIVPLIFIAAPWLFGFSDVDAAKTLSILVGVAMLVYSMMTKWRLSLAKVIPLKGHMTLDMAGAVVLIASPWIFGFSDEGGAARFVVIAGVVELLIGLATNWDSKQEVESAPGRRTAAKA